MTKSRVGSIQREILKTKVIKIDKLSSTDAPNEARDDHTANRPHIIIKKIEIQRISNDNESELESPSLSRKESTSRDFFRDDYSPTITPKIYAKGRQDYNDAALRTPSSPTRGPKSLYKSMIFAKGMPGQLIDPKKILERFVALAQ